jgi:hypothetical protein
LDIYQTNKGRLRAGSEAPDEQVVREASRLPPFGRPLHVSCAAYGLW